MKQIINIVEMQSGVISKITSFILPEESDPGYQEKVKEAEDKFTDIIAPYIKREWRYGGGNTTWNAFLKREAESCIDGGYYENGNAYEVALIWSEEVY